MISQNSVWRAKAKTALAFQMKTNLLILTRWKTWNSVIFYSSIDARRNHFVLHDFGWSCKTLQYLWWTKRWDTHGIQGLIGSVNYSKMGMSRLLQWTKRLSAWFGPFLDLATKIDHIMHPCHINFRTCLVSLIVPRRTIALALLCLLSWSIYMVKPTPKTPQDIEDSVKRIVMARPQLSLSAVPASPLVHLPNPQRYTCYFSIYKPKPCKPNNKGSCANFSICTEVFLITVLLCIGKGIQRSFQRS